MVRLLCVALGVAAASCAEGGRPVAGPRDGARSEGVAFSDLSAPVVDGAAGEGGALDGPRDVGSIADRGCAVELGIGAPCESGLPGICASGTIKCEGGKTACVPDHKPGQTSESCNGKDDDCDGKIDDGQLCANGNTCLGAQGCGCGLLGAPCGGSKHCCGGSCLETSSNLANCGACGASCGAGESCAGGRCQCGSQLGSVGGGAACSGGTSCVGGACQTCNATQNLAPLATASSSGGGSATDYTPAQLNNSLLQSSCKFHWVTATNSPGGAWVQYSWTTPVTVGSVWFDTVPAATGVCSTSAGRTLAGGKLQHWSGGAWSTIGTIAGKSDDWSHSFAPVTTTKLRLYDLVATSSGMAANPVIFEWRVFCQ
jgi:hypothetical protein